MGRATVREFARHGYDVGLIGRDALVAIGGLTRLYGLHRLLRRRR